MKAAFTIDRKIVNTALGRDVTDAICQQVALAETAAQGQAVLETEPDCTAANDIRQLIEEIEEFMQ